MGFKNAGARDSFVGGGSEEILRQARDRHDRRRLAVETVVDPSAQPGQETAPRVTRRPAVEAPPSASSRRRARPTETAARGTDPGPADGDADAHRDDPPADDGLAGAELLARRAGRNRDRGDQQ